MFCILVAIMVSLAGTGFAQFQYTTVDDPAGLSTQIIGLSGSTALGVYVDSSTNSHYFLLTGTAFTELALNPPGSLGGVVAKAISGSNILGDYTVSAPPGNQPAGFILSGTTYAELQAPGGMFGTQAFGLSGDNATGTFEDDDGKVRGFLLNGGTYKTLLPFNNVDGVAYCSAIDGANVVGSYNGNNVGPGFLYDEGGDYGFVQAPGATRFTSFLGISGPYIVGNSDAGSPFLLASGTFMDIADISGTQTNVTCVSGSTMGGYYVDSNQVTHGFIATIDPTVGRTANIALSPVDDFTNLRDTDGYGAVYYSYSIGAKDITLAQYCAFLNAVASSDPYGLYNLGMAYPFVTTNRAGIVRSGSAGSYTYLVTGAGNYPVTYVTRLDAQRFCNWLENGQPITGNEDATTTEEGSYTLDGDTTGGQETANAGAQWRLPTADEWYKAAFYDPTLNNSTGGYWLYATRSSTAPQNGFTLFGVNSTGSNGVNYFDGSTYTESIEAVNLVNLLTPVGLFVNSASPWGTFDQGGDVFQWLEPDTSSTSSAIAGGSWSTGLTYLQSTGAISGTTSGVAADNIGFRVVSGMEPSSASGGGINGAPNPGAYTLLLNRTTIGTPFGAGYATMRVLYNKKTKVYSALLAGRLSDGQSFRAAGALTNSAAGYELLVSDSLNYIAPAIRGERGSLTGSIAFVNSTGAALSGTLQWVKPRQTRGEFRPAIDTPLDVTGSFYALPAAQGGSNILPPSGFGSISDTAALGAAISAPVAMFPGGLFKVTTPGSAKIRVTSISLPTGVFRGMFLYPGSRPEYVPFAGVVIRPGGVNGGGFFISAQGSGKVVLRPEIISVTRLP